MRPPCSTVVGLGSVPAPTRVTTTRTATSRTSAGVQPQGCDVFDWIKCGGAVAGCVASCVENGPACIPQCVASVAPTCLKCL